MNNTTSKTLNDALVDVADIAYELTRYSGKLGEFAYSPERLDQWHAEDVRGRATKIAKVVAAMSDHDVEAVHMALTFVCAVDEYAAKEIAGRFMSAVKRLRVLRAIGSHPRALRFSDLCEAIEKGRYTKAQWDLAQKLAAEVRAA